jgi:Ca2+-binding RTX toxin-like protein
MADTTPPFLRSLNLPATIYFNTTVTLTALAQDDDSGVKAVEIRLSDSVIQAGPDKQTWSSHVIYFGDEVDSFFDGASDLQWTLSAPTEPGTYSVLDVYVVDKAGRSRTYHPEDLKNLGVRTSFNVSSSAPPTPKTPTTPQTLSDNALKLTGNASANVITGSVGNDTLNGGLGNDTLTGGGGQDAFVFNTKLGTPKTDRTVNFDKVTDFNVRDDSFHLDNAIFKKLGKGSEVKPGIVNKAFFTIGERAKDRNDYLIYNKKTGVLSYDADGSGAKDAVEFALLKKNLKLTYKDFFII